MSAEILLPARRRLLIAGPLVTTYKEQRVDTTDQASATFSAVAFGTGLAIVACGGLGAGSVTNTGCTIGGSGATALVDGSNIGGGGQTELAKLWALEVAGSTLDVVLTCNGTMLEIHMAAWLVTGGASLTPNDTQTDTETSTSNPLNVSINIPAEGNVIAYGYGNGTSLGFTTGGTGITEDFNVAPESNRRAAGASGDFASASASHAISFTPSTTHLGGMAAIALAVAA